MALIPLGAWAWASGSQVCMGATATLTPKPITNSAPAARVPGVRVACAAISASVSVPAWASTRATPNSTNTEPTALCTRYLTPASSEAGCVR